MREGTLLVQGLMVSEVELKLGADLLWIMWYKVATWLFLLQIFLF